MNGFDGNSSSYGEEGIASGSFMTPKLFLKPSRINLNSIPDRGVYFAQRKPNDEYFGNQFVIDLKTGKLKKQKFFVKDKKELDELFNQNYQPKQELYMSQNRRSHIVPDNVEEFSTFKLLESICDVLEDVSFGNSFFEMTESFQRLFTQTKHLYNIILAKKTSSNTREITHEHSKESAKKATVVIFKKLKMIAERRRMLKQIQLNLIETKEIISHRKIMSNKNNLVDLHNTITELKKERKDKIYKKMLALSLLEN